LKVRDLKETFPQLEGNISAIAYPQLEGNISAIAYPQPEGNISAIAYPQLLKKNCFATAYLR
jgi:hypothetical protein